jgi:glutamate-ammonia-ligase adenylyltransferase
VSRLGLAGSGQLLDDPTIVALAGAADPDTALVGLDRLVDALPGEAGRRLLDTMAREPGTRARLAAVLGASPALADHLAAHPSDWEILADDAVALVPPDARTSRERLLRAVGADPADSVPRAVADDTAVLDALRVAYRQALLVLAARDLTGAVSLDAATVELADLAAAAIDAALAVARAGLGPSAPPVRLAVIGMGKCGGRELNYVSDVDVLFVAEPPLPAESSAPAGAVAQGGPDDLNHALYLCTRLAEGIVRACGATTAQGSLFQVDVGLRPEGRDGPLVRTLASHEVYYRRWARTWEFQALLKARPIAGDLALGEQFCAMVAPMVWSAASRPGFVVDVRAMRRRVEQSLSHDNAVRNLKLGPGGLRDVEFAVQLLQLVHGRADPELRVPSTLGALAALAHGGYVGRQDATGLADAYRFLRNAEHRIQLRRLRRVHTLPVDPRELRWLARSLGLRSAEEFEATRAATASFVRRLHEKLFYQPLLEAVARLSEEEVRLTQGEAADRLGALGFTDPAQSLRHIQALSNGISRTAAIQRYLLPTLLPAFADATDPDAGLLAYRRLSEALGRTPWYLRMLRDSAGAADRLTYVLGASDFVADLMTRAPESVRLLRTAEDLLPTPSDQLAKTLSAIARRNPDAQDAVGRVRAVRRVELVRVACADLLGLLDVAAVGRSLSAAAAAAIEASLLIAIRKVAGGDDGDALPVRIAVIAMGRLGGEEISYGSDADVVFVHEPVNGADPLEAAAAAAAVVGELHKLLALPGPDPPLLLDATLRPEGRAGALSRTLDAYAAYYRRWSLGWEAQALLRARPLAGDVGLGRRFCRLADDVRFPIALPAAAVAEIERLRRRMETERIPRGVDRTLHLKLGPGGLTDVEWAVQIIQLRHGREIPTLRTTSTLEGLRAAVSAGLLGPREGAALAAAWTSASRIRNAIMLTRGRHGDVLPASGPALERIARIVGHPPDDADGLLADYRLTAANARKAVEALFFRERTGEFG